MASSSQRPAVIALVALTALALAPLCAKAGNDALVGVHYTTWFYDSSPGSWSNAWGTPVLGRYQSANRTVIRTHHNWLRCAGADFIVIDWSNNINCAGQYDRGTMTTRCPSDFTIEWLEKNTHAVMKEFLRQFKAGRKLRVAFMIGSPANPRDYQGGGRMWAQSQKVWDMYANHPKYSKMYFKLDGKPLLLDYVGTPVPFNQWGKIYPDWNDARFTTRHVTGFLSDQSFLLNRAGGDVVTKAGYWSWEDRNKNVWNLNPDGSPEATVVAAANRGDCANGWGSPAGTPWGCPRGLQTRRGGATFNERWARAINAKVDLVMVQSFNEWLGTNEEFDPERSNDLEPSRELGYFYLDLLKSNVQKYKASKGKNARVCNFKRI